MRWIPSIERDRLTFTFTTTSSSDSTVKPALPALGFWEEASAYLCTMKLFWQANDSLRIPGIWLHNKKVTAVRSYVQTSSTTNKNSRTSPWQKRSPLINTEWPVWAFPLYRKLGFFEEKHLNITFLPEETFIWTYQWMHKKPYAIMK